MEVLTECIEAKGRGISFGKTVTGWQSGASRMNVQVRVCILFSCYIYADVETSPHQNPQTCLPLWAVYEAAQRVHCPL